MHWWGLAQPIFTLAFRPISMNYSTLGLLGFRAIAVLAFFASFLLAICPSSHYLSWMLYFLPSRGHDSETFIVFANNFSAQTCLRYNSNPRAFKRMDRLKQLLKTNKKWQDVQRIKLFLRTEGEKYPSGFPREMNWSQQGNQPSLYPCNITVYTQGELQGGCVCKLVVTLDT